MVYSPLFFVACMITLFAVARLPMFACTETTGAGGQRRVQTLDGLRGILALSVVFHHVAIYRQLLETGEWTLPPSGFFAFIGQAGVAMFFMITGYLFWGKLLAEAGRPNWVRLYVGRLYRIGPLYLVLLALLVVSVIARAGWRINGTGFGFFKSFLVWLPFGMPGLGPTLNHMPQVTAAVGAATWTLHFEWIFYAALLPMAVFARSKRVALALCAIGLPVAFAAVASLVKPAIAAPPLVCAGLFLAGMTTATVQDRWPSVRLPQRAGSLLAAALILFACFHFRSAYNAGAMFVLALVFALVATGTSVFGLLTSRGAVRLGEMSYGIYLLHGAVLNALFAPDAVRHIALLSPMHFWAVALGGTLALLLLARSALLRIEQPGIAAGRVAGKRVDALVRRLAGRLPRLPALAPSRWLPEVEPLSDLSAPAPSQA